MRRLLTAALSVPVLGLVLGAAPALAQSGMPGSSFGYCHQTTGDIAECLNRAIADRNDAAAAVNNYGSSGATRDVPPTATTTTTTTTTYSRTIYPPPYPGAYR